MMDSCGFVLFAGTIVVGLLLWHREYEKTQVLLQKAYELGENEGHFRGWLDHANGAPLKSLPPTLYEIETALRQRHGWAGWSDSYYAYLRSDDLKGDDVREGETEGDWRARKLGELNQKYL